MMFFVRLKCTLITCEIFWGRIPLPSLQGRDLAGICLPGGRSGMHATGAVSQARINAMATTQNKCLRKIMGAYKRTPIAAIERESAIPPIDLHLQSQATQRAATTEHHKVTQEIETALQQIWDAATAPPRRARGRPRRERGPKPESAMRTLRNQ